MANSKSKSGNPKAWLAFERSVADLLKKFGYDVQHDTEINSGQTDIVATSPRRTIPNLIVECKHHEVAGSKVGIDEVENFCARVVTLRLQGQVDHGYLVTNTDFTAPAKGALRQQYSNFVFLVTYDELLATLVSADPYLKRTLSDLTKDSTISRYVDLRVVDTTAVLGTFYASRNGQWQRCSPRVDAAYSEDPDISNAWIMPQRDLTQLRNGECTESRNGLSINYMVPERFVSCYKAWKRECDRIDLTVAKGIEENMDSLRASYEDAKRRYAVEAAKILNLPAWEDNFELLARNPPSVPSTIRTRCYPVEPNEKSLRRLWNRIKKSSLKLDAQQQGPALTTTESDFLADADLLIKHGMSENAILLGAESAISALNDFLGNETQNLLVLLGDYGAGKSTLIRQFMWLLTQRKLQMRMAPEVRIPLLLNLRDYNSMPDFNKLVRTFLCDDADMGSLGLPMFRELNESGHFVLLLDGFDEMLSRVTKADRRRCFLEIAAFLGPKVKIILTGRPGYFPDHSELIQVLGSMPYLESDVGRLSIKCIQLFDDIELEQFLEARPDTHTVAKQLLNSNYSLRDLARRPVLAEIILQSASELAKATSKTVTIRDLYTVYTNKWVQREEDKGKFRLLIDPQAKAAFVRYLAVQMYLTGSLTISHSDLGDQIKAYFRLSDIESLDHFTHDIRTCSFLNRPDEGYRFIHKSFMEFFVAQEVELGGASPHAEHFQDRLSREIVGFLPPDNVWRKLLQKLEATMDFAESLGEVIRAEKERTIQDQDFERAAFLRDLEKWVRAIREMQSPAILEPMVLSAHMSARIPNPADVNRLLCNQTSDERVRLQTLFDQLRVMWPRD